MGFEGRKIVLYENVVKAVNHCIANSNNHPTRAEIMSLLAGTEFGGVSGSPANVGPMIDYCLVEKVVEHYSRIVPAMTTPSLDYVLEQLRMKNFGSGVLGDAGKVEGILNRILSSRAGNGCPESPEPSDPDTTQQVLPEHLESIFDVSAQRLEAVLKDIRQEAVAGHLRLKDNHARAIQVITDAINEEARSRIARAEQCETEALEKLSEVLERLSEFERELDLARAAAEEFRQVIRLQAEQKPLQSQPGNQERVKRKYTRKSPLAKVTKTAKTTDMDSPESLLEEAGEAKQGAGKAASVEVKEYYTVAYDDSTTCGHRHRSPERAQMCLATNSSGGLSTGTIKTLAGGKDE